MHFYEQLNQEGIYMKLKIITIALSSCLLANITPGFADTQPSLNLPLFSAFQRECGPDDIHIVQGKPAQSSTCTWKKTEDNDSGMQITLHFDDKVVQYAEADCTFTPAKDSSDKIRDLVGYKNAANNMLEETAIKDFNTGLGGNVRLHHQQITFRVLNPGVSDNANIAFFMTKWYTKWFWDAGTDQTIWYNPITWIAGASYTTGSTISCSFTPVLYTKVTPVKTNKTP